MVADFWNAMEEAERLRELAVFGLFELREALEREEERLGVHRDDPDLTQEHADALQAAWVRAERARIEIANEHPHLHATALISMVSALDAMVEELVPTYQLLLVDGQVDEAARIAREREPEAFAKVGSEWAEKVLERLRTKLREGLPKPKRPGGPGTRRYENPLAQVGLGAPADRAIPPEFDEALTEVTALRNVLVHRAGRVDGDALRDARTLEYADGAFVRINRPDYRRYSAALRCYGAEVVRRAMLGLYDGTEHDVDLSQWRNWYRVNA